MNSASKSLKPSEPKSKSREVRKLEAERDRAQGALLRIKTRRKEKKIRQQRQTLGRQVVNLTIRHTHALVDGEI